MKVRKTAFSGDTPAAGVVTERHRTPSTFPEPLTDDRRTSDPTGQQCPGGAWCTRETGADVTRTQPWSSFTVKPT